MAHTGYVLPGWDRDRIAVESDLTFGLLNRARSRPS
jgi:hypothetical protein